MNFVFRYDNVQSSAWAQALEKTVCDQMTTKKNACFPKLRCNNLVVLKLRTVNKKIVKDIYIMGYK